MEAKIVRHFILPLSICGCHFGQWRYEKKYEIWRNIYGMKKKYIYMEWLISSKGSQGLFYGFLKTKLFFLMYYISALQYINNYIEHCVICSKTT